MSLSYLIDISYFFVLLYMDLEPNFNLERQHYMKINVWVKRKCFIKNWITHFKNFCEFLSIKVGLVYTTALDLKSIFYLNSYSGMKDIIKKAFEMQFWMHSGKCLIVCERYNSTRKKCLIMEAEKLASSAILPAELILKYLKTQIHVLL